MANNAGSTSKPPPIIFLTAFPLVKCFRKNGDILFTAIDMEILFNEDLCQIALIDTNNSVSIEFTDLPSLIWIDILIVYVYSI